MFLKTYLDVPVSLASFKMTLSWEPERCFGGLGETACDEAERLLVETGLEQIRSAGRGSEPDGDAGRRPARLHLGDVLAEEHLVSVPMELEVDGSRDLPSLHGTIDAAWLGPERSYLSLSAQYEMAPDLLESASQRAVFHRVVEVVAQRLLVKFAECLCVNCAPTAIPAVLRPASTD
jgi:hypothetical protein